MRQPGPSRLALIAGILLTTSLARPVPAQDTGRITGVVTDSSDNRPLPAVQVSVGGTRLGAMTDEAGRYTVNAVPAGRYTVTARRLGYRPSIAQVTVGTGAAASANFQMSAVGLTLEAVVTTGVVDPTEGKRVPFTVGRVDAENAPVPASNALER